MVSTEQFLDGGGAMGARLRAHCWATSPIGETNDWPPPLRSSLSLMLSSGFPTIVMWGPELVLLYNDAYAPILGAKHPWAIGRPMRDVWPETMTDLKPLIARAMAGEALFVDDMPLQLHRHGFDETAYFTFYYSPLRAESGVVEGISCGCIETTEKASKTKQVNDLLQDRNDFWNFSPDMIVVLDYQGRFLEVSPSCEKILGYTPAEMVGRVYTQFLHPDDILRSQGQAEASFADGRSVDRFENRYRCKDGSHRWLSWTGSSARGRFYATAQNVSELKLRDAELTASREALRQSQKMEAVGQLTGGLAHDFNNLLMGVMGNLQLIQMRAAKGRFDEIDRFVTAAQGAGTRAAALTQRLLAFSRRQTLDPKPTDVNRLIASLNDLLRRTVGVTVDIEVVGAAGLWTANIDAAQLENAILNLCINGRDAMPHGGRLTIETSNRWVDDRIGREQDMPPGQYIAACVTDTGTGMTPDVIEHAFEPFFTTKPIGQGTGLGLSMIYGFAKQSGGQVRIYSEPGNGTTVCIYLPRHLGEVPDSLAFAAGDLTETPEVRTVLVVDDEATIRDLIQDVLRELGYAVICAADGPASIKILQSATDIDLLITDVALPNGLNGRQVADAARALRPELQILFITGFAENAVFASGHLDVGMELLTKPFTLEALSMKVEDMLRIVP